jgi:hypothetical protein
MEQAGKFRLVPDTHFEDPPIAKPSKEIERTQFEFMAYAELAQVEWQEANITEAQMRDWAFTDSDTRP